MKRTTGIAPPPREESKPESSFSRRTVLKGLAAATLMTNNMTPTFAQADQAAPSSQQRPWLKIRGIYGGFTREIFQRGETPGGYGVNAVWVGSGGLNAKEIDRYHELGIKVFVEFNSMHWAEFLKDHPDAAPIGPDGKPSPPPDGWQGVSPFHAGYRRERMQEFRRVLKSFEIDGVWLDYHHAHASWEQAQPNLPDSDFSPAALKQFTAETGITLPRETAVAAAVLLGAERQAWTRFRCGVFTDWVREYREVLDDVRPKALLGTFHCPWAEDDHEGAIRHKLAIDLPAQSPYLDVFSIMPYHARFGHAGDLAWISRQVRCLGELLRIEGSPGEKKQIWPIVQLADWGESVPVEQVEPALDFGSRPPATGVMAFHWHGVSKQWNKLEALKRAYTSFLAG